MIRFTVAGLALALSGCADAAPDTPAAVPVGGEVVVLGDSTGNELDEWPAEWGRTLTDERRVLVRSWDFDRETFAPTWTDLGGTGGRLRIWNLSQPGATADYPLADGRLDAIPVDPSVVILSFGYNGFVEDAVPSLAGLADAVERRWPDAVIVVTAQGPVTAAAGELGEWQRQKVPAIREWAAGRGYAAVDVWAAFEEASDDLSLLVDADGIHPNDRGTAVWVTAVEEVLGS